MKKGKKKRLAIAAAALLCMGNMTTVQAGTWQQDGIGWWWREADGTYPASSWQWIDGDGNGTAECYYFNPSGYCLLDTVTPDGYLVDASGAWIVDGIVQQKAAGTGAAAGQGTGLSYERIKERLLAYYNDQRADDGDYVIFDTETKTTSTGYSMMIRYQMSDAEVEERFRRGGMPMANILVDSVVVDKHTGIAVLESGESIQLR